MTKMKGNSINHFPYWHFNALLLQWLPNVREESLHLLTHPTLVHFSGHESWTATFPTGFMFVWRICFHFQVLLRFLKYQACLVTRNSCHSLLALTCTWRKQVFKCRVWKQCHFQAPSRALMFRFQREMYPRALLFRSSGAKLPRGQGPACGAHGECGALVLPPNV